MPIRKILHRAVVGVTIGALSATGLIVAVPVVAAEEVPVVNGSFEEWTTADSWVASGWTMTTPVWVSNAAARTGTYSQSVNQWSSDTTLSQTITAPEGSYDVAVFAWANESMGASTLTANGVSEQIVSGGAVQIDGSKTWDEIIVEDVPVGPDGQLQIEIQLDDLTSPTLTGYLDDVTVRPAGQAPEEPEPSDSFLTEPGFEEAGAAWTIGGELLDEGRSGSAHSVRHSGAGVQETSQVVENLADGYYRLTAWVQNDGGIEEAFIFAEGGGESEGRTAVPRTNFAYDAAGTWKKTTLRGVHVTSGQLEVGLRTTGDGAGTVRIDDLALVKDEEPYEMLVGGDVSFLNIVEDVGGRYYDADGRERDALQILADNGWNIVRLRVYHDPGKGRGDGTYYVPEGYLDSADALDIAKRAKAAGLQIQLSFHYSDYWTNPGLQMIPHAWQTLIQGQSEADAVTTLETELHDYTKELLDQMAAQGTSPEYVSIGNETRGGMLFPYGTTGNWPNLARFYNAGAEAVRESAPDAKVIIHLDDGGNTSTYQSYFTNADNLGVDYDIIGSSYYPYWTNKTAQKFAEFATTITQQFDKPMMVMETGFNWNPTNGEGKSGQLQHNGPYGAIGDSTPELQRDFMVELFNELQGVPGGLAIGDIYWDPMLIYTGGQTPVTLYESTDSADGNAIDNTAQFDFSGKALAVLDAYRLNTRGVAGGTVAGTVTDAGHQPVPGATVTLSDVSGESRMVKTNSLGDYYLPHAAAGEYTIQATTSDLGASTAAPATVSAGDRTAVDLQVTGEQSLANVSGSVTANGVAGIAYATVKINGDDFNSATLTGADGSFELTGVPDGEYTLSASKWGYVTSSSTVQVSGSNITRVIDLVADVGSVTGTVVGPDREPLVGVQVSLGSRTATTAADGKFLLTQVPSGEGLVVTAKLSGYRDTLSSPLTVTHGETTDDVQIILATDVPIVNGSFEVAGPGGDATAEGWTFTSDPAGGVVRQNRVVFGGTADGEYAATLWLEQAYNGSLEQVVTAPSTGVYSVRASVLAGPTGTFTLYVKDETGAVIAEKQVTGSQTVELPATVTGSTFTVGFEADAGAGDWAVVDLVTVGFLGEEPVEPVTPPTATVAPSVTGSALVGKQLTAESGTWSEEGLSFSYQWLRDGEPIAGATASTYRVKAVDKGASLSITVTATPDSGPTGVATSSEVTVQVASLVVAAPSPLLGTSKTTFNIAVQVSAIGGGTATGEVSVKVNGQTLNGTLKNGKVTVKVGTLPRGLHTVDVSYAGSDTVAASKGKTIVIVLW